MRKISKTKITAHGKRYGREFCCDNANLIKSRRKRAVKYAHNKAKRQKGASLACLAKLALKGYNAKIVKNAPNRSLKPKRAFCAVKFEKAATPHGKSPLATQI